MLPPDLILDRALLISFYAGFVFFFHHIQQFCNRSAGIGFSANFHCLGKFCCPTMPCGICGGNFFANNLCCGRIIPEINCLVAHETRSNLSTGYALYFSPLSVRVARLLCIVRFVKRTGLIVWLPGELASFHPTSLRALLLYFSAVVSGSAIA